MKQKILCLLTAIIFLTSCANVNSLNHEISAQAYLQKAAKATGTAKQNYLLKAANRYLQDRQPDQAAAILATLPPNLPPSVAAKQQLLQANILLLQNHYPQALNLLQRLTANMALLQNTTDRMAFYQLTGYAYEKTGNLLASINQRTALLSLEKSATAKQQTLKNILYSVQSTPSNTLTTLMQQTSNSELKGWLQLGLITQPNTPPAALAQALKQWQTQYPQHPANMLLSKKSNTLSKNTSSRQIALLLPLSGPLGGSGNAVRNGFFAAYYQMKASQNNAPTILVFNTYGKNIIQVYQQALQQGADFIVGPLTKTSLQTLADSRVIKVPTLALNNITDKHAVANPRLFQFGLSPNDEAQQIAQKAWNEHHRRALVIAPANAWGQGIAQVFMNQWQSLGGQVVGIMRYSSLAALPGQIQNLLKVDQSQQKLSQLKQILGEKLRSTPTHRQDADMIFLLAQPNMARQINPLIKYYYGGDLPIYATSEIYTGLPNSIRDRDLDGIIFCDMPWTLNPNHLQPTYLNTIQQNIKQLWLSSYNRYIKLYALGIDAYRLVNKLNNPTLSALGVNGASGKLYLLNNQQIYRSLQWAKMQHGIPVVLNN